MRHAARRRSAALFLAVTIGMLGVPAWSSTAAAQTTTVDEPTGDADAPPAEVTLVSQSHFVQTGQDFTIRLRVEGARPTDRLKYVIWERAERDQLRAATASGAAAEETDLRDAGLVRVLGRTVPTRYEELVDATGTVTLTIPEQGVVPTGVYPVNIHLVRDGRESEPLLTTTLVRVGPVDPTAGPLDVALVLPLRADLAHHADGTIHLDPDERRRLLALVDLVERHPEVPFALAPSPETIDALAQGTPEDREALERIAVATRSRAMLGGPYVPIDEEALRAAGLDLLVADLHNAGTSMLQTYLGDPDMSTAQLDTTDNDRTLLLRRDLGAHRLIVGDDLLEPLDPDDFPAVLLQPFVLEDSTGTPMRAFAADSTLAGSADRLDDGERRADQPLEAQRFLADLAAGYADDPDLRRGTIVVLPAGWDPTAAAADELLTTLAGFPHVRFASLRSVQDTVPVATPAGRAQSQQPAPLVRALRPGTPADLDSYATRVEQTNRRLRALDAIVASGTATTPAHALQRASADERLRADERRRYLDGADNLVSDLLNPGGTAGLVGPGSQRVTMTSRRATIPIQIENRLGFPVNVSLELRSEKLDFPDGWFRAVTLVPGPNTIEVDVESKVSGDSLLEVTVLPPGSDRSLGPLTQGTFTVRSTALSGVGVVLSALAVAVLLGWWARHVVRSRRAKRATAAADATALAAPPLADPPVAAAPADTTPTDSHPQPLTRTEP